MRSSLFTALLLTTSACGYKALPVRESSAHVSSDEHPHPVKATPDPRCAPTLLGDWSLSWYEGQDYVGPNGERPIGMALNYSFKSDGTYTMDGYPPITERGRYAVKSRDGNTLTVHFSDRVSDGSTQDQDVTYTFSDCATKVAIPGKIFTRTPAR